MTKLENSKRLGRLTCLALLATCLEAAALPVPDLAVNLDAASGEIVLTWPSEPLNPGSATGLFYGFQLEESRDLAGWQGRGDVIPTRVGGGGRTHEIRVPRASAASFFRLRLMLDLAGQDLRGSDLSGLDLGGADLSGADLSGADLRGTLLAGAGLGGVRLDSLGGAAGGLVTGAIPYFPYDSSVTTFDTDRLEAVDTLLVFPQPGATIGELNALIAAHGGTIVGGFGGNPDQGEEGMLVVHFPELAPGALPAIVQAFADSPAVSGAYEDLLLMTDALPDLTGAIMGWRSWDGPGRAGNWGLRLCRFPQAWNFNEVIHERIFDHGEPERFTRIGVIDDGFDVAHLELAPRISFALTPNVKDHGTHVAGTIAAGHNGLGIDGATPWADLRVIGSNVFWLRGSPLEGTKAYGEMLSDLVTHLSKRHHVKVVNISMGIHWRCPTINKDPTTDMVEQTRVITRASNFYKVASRADAPIIVNSAGNEGYPARWNGPATNAAIFLNHPHIFVVEALTGLPTGGESIVANWPGFSFGSNYAGNLSAPGFGVLSCVEGGYASFNGTSMAAPHVTGLIAFLYSIQPDLTKDEVMDLVRVAAEPVSGASARIDAFSAVMDIDKIRDGQHILRALVDIDDRTADGNQRITMLAKTDAEADPQTFDAEAFDEDDYGMIGDGQVDMSDFRRFRDWNLLVMDEEGLVVATDSLDGPLDHPKNDPNRNRKTHNHDSYDRYYPRTDFNGDGLRYDPARSIPVAGVFDGESLDDLEILQELFEDTETNYSPVDLPGLIASSDLHISLYWFMKWNQGVDDAFDIHQVRVRIQSRSSRTTRVYFVPVPDGDPDRGAHFLITLPAPDEHRVFVCGEVGGIVGELGESGLIDFDDKFGRDGWFAPRVLLDGEPCEPDPNQ